MNDGTSRPADTISFVCFASEVPFCIKSRRRFPISGRTTLRAGSFFLRNSSKRVHCVPFPEPEIPKKARVKGLMLFKIIALSAKNFHDFIYRLLELPISILDAVIVFRSMFVHFHIGYAHSLGKLG